MLNRIKICRCANEILNFADHIFHAMKNFKLFSVGLLLILFQSCSPDQQLLPENTWIIEPGSRPMVIAHGGAKLLFPENTWVAFDSCFALGVDVFEMDLRMTKDSVIVTHHDAEIDLTSNGSGKIADLTLSELQNLNFGYHFTNLDGDMPYKNKKAEIATLDGLFKKYGQMKMIIEIKDDGEWGKTAAEKVYQLIVENNMKSRVIVASFHDEIINYFLKISNSEIPVSAPEHEAVKFALTAKSFTGFTFVPEAVAIQIPLKSSGLNLGTRRIINSCHHHNMAIHYWTINDKEEMRGLIEKGADGLITDRPDIMKDLLIEMNL